jgi:hypothetical protein
MVDSPLTKTELIEKDYSHDQKKPENLQNFPKKSIFNNFQILHTVSTHFEDSISKLKSM